MYKRRRSTSLSYIYRLTYSVENSLYWWTQKSTELLISEFGGLSFPPIVSPNVPLSPPVFWIDLATREFSSPSAFIPAPVILFCFRDQHAHGDEIFNRCHHYPAISFPVPMSVCDRLPRLKKFLPGPVLSKRRQEHVGELGFRVAIIGNTG